MQGCRVAGLKSWKSFPRVALRTRLVNSVSLVGLVNLVNSVSPVSPVSSVSLVSPVSSVSLVNPVSLVSLVGLVNLVNSVSLSTIAKPDPKWTREKGCQCPKLLNIRERPFTDLPRSYHVDHRPEQKRGNTQKDVIGP